MFLVLNIVGPKYIITQNWISIRESLYCVWTKKHRKSKFIVIQHGAYVGGIITDIAHRYTKCDIFWVWGEYFLDTFDRLNKGKSVRILSLGNPVYNKYERNQFNYKETEVRNILLSPSVFDSDGLHTLVQLVELLTLLNFNVSIKLHSMQFKLNNDLTKISLKERLYKNILEGELYELLEYQKFDLVISDHSSVILDAIFFKNRVLYFDAFNDTREDKTVYSKYLTNLFREMNSLVRDEQLIDFVSIENQERLFCYMATNITNDLKLLDNN
jgi:hypothetical protein